MINFKQISKKSYQPSTWFVSAKTHIENDIQVRALLTTTFYVIFYLKFCKLDTGKRFKAVGHLQVDDVCEIETELKLDNANF